MKVLSMTQPWATLVAIGAKKIETRSWPTAYRGPLAIHASKAFPGYAKDLLFKEPFFTALGLAGFSAAELLCATAPKQPSEILPLGKIIAVCHLTACQPTEAANVNEPECSFGDFSPGRWGWMLEDVCALPKPIAARGLHRLWTLAPDVLEQLQRFYPAVMQR